MRTCVARLKMIVRINLAKVIAILSACDMITRLTICCYCINFTDINFRYICCLTRTFKAITDTAYIFKNTELVFMYK